MLNSYTVPIKDKDMKRKIYTSMSIPHFSIGGIRIAFTPLSTRSSYFETTDESLQKKIEAHPWFGDKFRLKAVEEDTKVIKAKEKKANEPKTLEKMSFTTLADAKEWLAKEHNVARSNIKRKEDAVSAGRTFGVDITIGVQAEAQADTPPTTNNTDKE